MARRKLRRRRVTMGANPLDLIVPAKAAVKASRRGLAPIGTTPRKEKSPRPAKVRATFHLPLDLFEEARNAVVFLSGPPARLTLAGLAEAALRGELERLKKRYNAGKAFPRREAELRGGRPIS